MKILKFLGIQPNLRHNHFIFYSESMMVIVEKSPDLDPFIQKPKIQQNPQNIENADSSDSEITFDSLK